MNTKTESLFERLNLDTYYGIDRDDANVTTEELEEFVNSQEYDTSDGLVIGMIASHPNVPQGWASDIAHQKEGAIGALYTTGGRWNSNLIDAWIALAANPYVSPEILTTLYLNAPDETFLTHALAGNPSTPRDVVELIIPRAKLPLTLYQLNDEGYEKSDIPYAVDFSLLEKLSERPDLTEMSKPALKELVTLIGVSLLQPINGQADFHSHLKIIGRLLAEPRTAKLINRDLESAYIVKSALN